MTLKDKYILVLGGAGYVGSHVNKYLNKVGYKTICCDNLIRGCKNLAKYGYFIPLDLSDSTQLSIIFKHFDIDAVMHFAAFAYVGESVTRPDLYYMNNVANTLNLLNNMKQFNINKLIFSSTCAIYGNPQYVPIDEDHPKNPINPYGRSKLMIEEILEDYSKAFDLKYVSLRYFNVAGADLEGEIGECHNPETHIIPLLLDAALKESNTFTVYGNDYNTKDGTCIRDYIHVMDLADAHKRAYEWLNENNKSEVCNLGTSKSYSVFEIIKEVEKITNKKINYKIGPKREGDPPVLIASNKKAKDILQFNCKYSDIEIIIKTAFEWHKKQKGMK
jgi:UDP-glucose 4-epimerase